jgi:hypothetical protein
MFINRSYMNSVTIKAKQRICLRDLTKESWS